MYDKLNLSVLKQINGKTISRLIMYYGLTLRHVTQVYHCANMSNEKE